MIPTPLSFPLIDGVYREHSRSPLEILSSFTNGAIFIPVLDPTWLSSSFLFGSCGSRGKSIGLILGYNSLRAVVRQSLEALEEPSE